MLYYGLRRRIHWLTLQKHFAIDTAAPLAHLQFTHQTILLRQLKDVDMQYQYNKIHNLKLAAAKLDGIILHPGQIFSYWYLIGKPTHAKGYIEGMVLQNGSFGPGVGGGLCQLSNLIYWMSLHTPLTVIERHRHGYDVFPDAQRTQPFGSGATCFYPHGDLMIRNDTDQDYQLMIKIGNTHLIGEWRASCPASLFYKVIEKNHEIKGEYWGAYSRHNQLYQQTLSLEGELLAERLIVANSAIMMYSPFLNPPNTPSI